MTKDQLSYYRSLWAAACHAQGWDADDAVFRRQVRIEIVGQESTRTLTEEQITHLYNHLRFLARPDDLGAAMTDAGPTAAATQNRHRQHLHVIHGLGFADAYILRVAAGAMRRERVRTWPELSLGALNKLRWTLTTRARKRDAAAGKRAPFVPRAVPYHQREETKTRRYVLRPSPGLSPSDRLPF